MARDWRLRQEMNSYRPEAVNPCFASHVSTVVSAALTASSRERLVESSRKASGAGRSGESARLRWGSWSGSGIWPVAVLACLHAQSLSHRAAGLEQLL